MFCCPRCFDDATLDKIFQRRTERFGECLYCGSEDVRILAPPELLDDFEAVLGAYTGLFPEICGRIEGVCFAPGLT